MKKCLACGRENSDEMNFCLDCGKPLDASPVVWPNDAPTTAFGETPRTVRGQSIETQSFEKNIAVAAPPRSRKKPLLWIASIVAVVALLVVAAGLAFVGYKYYVRSGPVPLVSNGNATPATKPSPGASAIPTPSPSFTPPTEPTKKGTFSVYANGGWQLSEIDTVPLENFRTKVDGKVDLDGVKTGITAKGVNDAASRSRRIYPEFATGALLMRTHYADGKFSNVAVVLGQGSTGQWRNFPDERGRIEFCINDNAPEKNGGQFTVTVTMTSVPKAKK